MSIQHPLGLWLARKHAYYPVQVIHYALAGDPELIEERAIELSGRRYLPHDWYVVDRLMPVEGALLPGLGRKLPRRRRQRARAARSGRRGQASRRSGGE